MKLFLLFRSFKVNAEIIKYHFKALLLLVNEGFSSTLSFCLQLPLSHEKNFKQCVNTNITKELETKFKQGKETLS